MLIFSRRTVTPSIGILTKHNVFCNALPFQQAPMDVCVSNRSRVTVGFVKTVAYTPPKKKRKNLWRRKCVRRDIFRTIEVRVEGGVLQPLLCLQHVQLCHCATCQGSSYTKNEYDLFFGKWGTKYSFSVFFSKNPIPSDLNPKNWF